MIQHCHRCVRSLCAGSCPCPVDGIDITAHAAADYCPHPDGPRFGASSPPADWLAIQYVRKPTHPIPADYQPLPENATLGRCCS